jgi:cytochrome P450
MMDSPDHTALRKLVIKRFTLKQVMAIEPLVPTFVVERVERLREAWEGDAVIELFKPLPSLVAGHFFGVPEADRSLFDGWTDATVTANANGDITAAGDAAGARHVLQPADRASSKRARRRHDLGSGACKTGRVRSVPGQDSGFCLHHGDRGQ